MKIMLVGTDGSMSGAGLSMIALAENLKLLGQEVVIVVKPGNTERILTQRRIDHYVVNCQSWIYSSRAHRVKRIIVGCIKGIINIPAYFKYKRIIKSENPDVVHINAATSGCAGLAALICRKKLVWHIREMMEEDLGASFTLPLYSRYVMSKADKIIAISEAVYEKFHIILPNSSIIKIYNGIELTDYYSESHIIFSNKNVVFTIAGRINANKGQYDVIVGLADIIKRIKCELWIVGDGDIEEINRIKEYIKTHDIPENKIIFHGRVNNMPEIWKMTDIAIVASKCEAFGRVTVEAMAAGCLVVGANTGGTAELIVDGKTGLLYRQGNSDDLEKRVNYAIDNKESMKYVASVGKKYAVDQFTAKKNAEKVLLVYQLIE